MTNNKKHPVFLNLFQIHLPVAGVMSIAHRIAGVLLFIAIPFWLYLLEMSLISSDGYTRAVQILNSTWLLPLNLLLLWAVMHHLLAGIRYLLLDIDVAIEKPFYRLTAMAVMVMAPTIVLLILLVMI